MKRKAVKRWGPTVLVLILCGLLATPGCLFVENLLDQLRDVIRFHPDDDSDPDDLPDVPGAPKHVRYGRSTSIRFPAS